MPTPIRVTFVEPSLAPYRVPFFRALAKRHGIAVRVLFAESGRVNAKPDGFEAIFAPRHTMRLLGQPIYWQPAQITAADADLTDVISFDWDVHYASLVPALIKAKRQGIGTILWGHGTSGNDGTWKAMPRFALARLADVLVTYSSTARLMYLSRGWPTNRVFCASNALDQTPIQAAYEALRHASKQEPSAIQFARQSLSLSSEGPVLLFVSRLDAVRRLDVLVDAVQLLVNRWPTLQVVLVGDGKERLPIEQRANALGMSGRFRFAGAEYDESRLAAWYAAADIVVHPAWLGLSVYHAMGHRRPVVTGDDPAFHPPEAASIIHEETGLQFTHGDAAACAAAIDRLLSDEPLRVRLGETARTRAIAEHSIEPMVAGFESAIRQAARMAGRSS